ncbi:hypothetical protein DFH08DRAFT_685331 [Mycena albidolilacea]|uniref:Uncharacterized protein n=1 Tax=Mycena albidolilacea TaxID=1033008 RepID=A0AAD7AL99_9AGAR|nr:hypothetical protein DFH08DRAFT_685331 [Mycena albidolilacea]
MIAGLSKAATLYLAPVLTLTAIILSLLVYLAPVLLLHDKVALLTVTPSTALFQNASSHAIDGPSVFLGVLGSCSRPKNDAGVNCTTPTLNPIYDVSKLPSSAPRLLLSAPTQATPVFLGIGLACSVIFFITFTLISFRHKMGEKMSASLDKPLIQRLSAWLGFFGFMIGITSFLILRMWFGKASDDFNDSIAVQGSGAPQLIANVGNAFTMVWVAYAFYGIPLIISLSKLNVKATK